MQGVGHEPLAVEVPQMQLMSDEVLSRVFVQGMCDTRTSVTSVSQSHILLRPV